MEPLLAFDLFEDHDRVRSCNPTFRVAWRSDVFLPHSTQPHTAIDQADLKK